MLLEPQTADIVLPGDRERLELVRDWVDGHDYIEAADAGAGAAVRSFRAGAAFAVLSGSGRARAVRGRRRGQRGVARARLHGFQFTPLPPGS